MVGRVSDVVRNRSVPKQEIVLHATPRCSRKSRKPFTYVYHKEHASARGRLKAITELIRVSFSRATRSHERRGGAGS